MAKTIFLVDAGRHCSSKESLFFILLFFLFMVESVKLMLSRLLGIRATEKSGHLCSGWELLSVLRIEKFTQNLDSTLNSDVQYILGCFCIYFYTKHQASSSDQTKVCVCAGTNKTRC